MCSLPKEICICAAIKMGDLIIRGHRHDDALRSLQYRINNHYVDAGPIEQGFITSKNRFVGREEAMRLQKAAGAKSAACPEGTLRGTLLFSEDLY